MLTSKRYPESQTIYLTPVESTVLQMLEGLTCQRYHEDEDGAPVSVLAAVLVDVGHEARCLRDEIRGVTEAERRSGFRAGLPVGEPERFALAALTDLGPYEVLRLVLRLQARQFDGLLLHGPLARPVDRAICDDARFGRDNLTTVPDSDIDREDRASAWRGLAADRWASLMRLRTCIEGGASLGDTVRAAELLGAHAVGTDGLSEVMTQIAEAVEELGYAPADEAGTALLSALRDAAQRGWLATCPADEERGADEEPAEDLDDACNGFVCQHAVPAAAPERPAPVALASALADKMRLDGASGPAHDTCDGKGKGAPAPSGPGTAAPGPCPGPDQVAAWMALSEADFTEALAVLLQSWGARKNGAGVAR